MKEEIEYLNTKITELVHRIQRDIDYGYSGEIVDDKMDELRILTSIKEILEDI